MTDLPKTLVLNSDYSPISAFPLSVIDATEAVKRVVNGTCYVVEEYDRLIKSPNIEMNWPSVIIRKQYLKRENTAILRPEALYYRDDRKCAYTGKFLSLKDVTIDHVIPESKGGKTEWNNVVIASYEANQAKGDKMPIGIWKPRIKPYTPTYSQLVALRKKYPIMVYHPTWVPYLGDWKAEIVVNNIFEK